MEKRALAEQQSGSRPAQEIRVPGITPSDFACHWVKLGFGVFPMPKRLKCPIVDDWPRLALTSVDDVETYWHSFCRPGWTNLALTLPNHVVVDVDPKNNGWQGLADLEADHGPLPLTRRHRTGSGGLHFVYARHPGCDGLMNKPLDPWRYPGIDIKVNGNGLIVAPGSESRAGLYSIVDDRECEPAPAFLLDVQKNARYQPPMNAPHASYGAARMTFDELAALPADDPYRSSYPWNGQVCGHLAKKHFPNYEVYVTEALKLNNASIDPHPDFMETADRIWSKEQARRTQDAADHAAFMKNHEVPSVRGEEPSSISAGTPSTLAPVVAMPDRPGDGMRRIKWRDGATQVQDLIDAVNDGAIPDVYVHGGQLVHVHDVYGSPTLSVGEVGKDIAPLDADVFGMLLAANVFHYSFDEETKREERKQSAAGTRRQALAAGTWPGVPPLLGIIQMPVLRADGSILTTPGYDHSSGLYFHPRQDFSDLAADPTPEQVKQARAFLLDELLFNFPFAADADRANYLGLLATPPLRRFISGSEGLQPTPLGLNNAHSAGTGKTLLAEIINYTYGGKISDFPENEDELRKHVVSLLREPGAVCVLDNIGSGHQVRSPTLAALITQPYFTGRVLGQSRVSTMVNDRLWMVTGNNVRLGGDIASRTVLVNLDADMERPDLRTGFRIPSLDAWIQRPANQARVLRCVLTLCRSWVMAGAPAIDTPMRQFTGWASAMAGFLDFHGVPGFLGNADKVGDADTEREAWTAFLSAWYEKFETRPVGVKELLHSTMSVGDDGWGDAFLLVDANTGKELSGVKAGNKLHEQLNRPIDGLVLRQVPKSEKSKKSNLYYVERHGG